MEETKVKKYIIKELLKFKFKRQTKGFKYLIETIYLAIIEPDRIDNLKKDIFPKVAEKYNEKSYLNVKWCIDRVIVTMYNNTEMKIICKYFDLDENIKPSLKFIVYTIMTKYQNKNN